MTVATTGALAADAYNGHSPNLVISILESTKDQLVAKTISKTTANKKTMLSDAEIDEPAFVLEAIRLGCASRVDYADHLMTVKPSLLICLGLVPALQYDAHRMQIGRFCVLLTYDNWLTHSTLSTYPLPMCYVKSDRVLIRKDGLSAIPSAKRRGGDVWLSYIPTKKRAATKWS